MLLSVVIPVRNEILYISKLFVSIINASSKVESELFFIDGLSDDGTYEWLKNAIKTIDNCKLFRNDKKYVSHGFNQIYNNTKGEFISRLDTGIPFIQKPILLMQLKYLKTNMLMQLEVLQII